jgi:YD repeat-containing protein
MSFHWGPRALDALLNGPNPNPDDWGWTEMMQARITGSLLDPNYYDHVTDMPDYIQEPSPDGATQGQVTFFDYPGKSSPQYPGTSRWPSVTARRLPNGETQWSYTPHNAQGRILLRKETYTQSTGTVGVRTVASYTYDANGYDLLEERDGAGKLRKTFTWDANHRLMTKREYFGPGPTDYYETSFTYNPTYGLPATRTDPAGLVTTWTYTPAGGGANGYTVTKTTSPIVSTETEVWSNGRRVSHTDALGFTRNFTYDALDRVTRIDYPSDGTYELFVYVRDSDGAPLLDLDTHRNRLGGLTH